MIASVQSAVAPNRADPPARPTQLADVARAAGVAKSTVAAALRPGGGGKQARVGEATAERIRALAAALGYRPNPLAGGLRGAATRSVACLWHFVDPWSLDGTIGSELLWDLQQQGYATYQVEHPRKLEQIFVVLENLLARRPDALVIRPASWLMEDPRLIGVLQRFRAVLAVLPWPMPAWEIDQLVHDRDVGIREVATHFARTGRTRPVAILNLRDATDRRKLAVFRDACREAGIAEHPGDAIDLGRDLGVPQERAAGYLEAMERGFGGRVTADALFCANDLGVMAVAKYLREHGVAVGRDVALVGLNDPPPLALWDPPLASIDRNQSELVRVALAMLCERMASPATPPQVQTVPMRFVWRASAG